VQVLRHLGLAARFVSGYLIQLRPDVKSLDGPSGTEVDFTDLHAWCEVYLPGAGWVGLDPTSGLMAGEGHIPVACTPEPSTAAPVSGAVDACEVTFEHHMHITRVYESPRVTKPYTDEQWQAVLALGHEVDAQLQQQDVRLTMGGEPTFVAVDDRDGAEWNTDALGPPSAAWPPSSCTGCSPSTAGRLPALRPGQVVPGRAVAALGAVDLLARRRQPCWHDPSLFADERDPHRYTSADAHAFIGALTRRLGLDPSTCSPATRTPSTTCGASAGCRSTSTPSSPNSTTRWSASGCAASSAGAGRHRGLRAAAAQANASGKRAGRPAAGSPALVPARRPPVPDPRRLADGLPAAAGLAALGGKSDQPFHMAQDPFAERRRCPRRRCARAAPAYDAAPGGPGLRRRAATSRCRASRGAVAGAAGGADEGGTV
jgi:hypothetical protein